MTDKRYVNEDNLQIAITEYKELSVGKDVLAQYNENIGTVTHVYDNTSGDGEQVYFMLYYK
ncbi:hypothetical protein D8824_08050 [Streptococcus intermedius]|uniref:hypothetical protein n=1 Tax=Streptococcus intermedius TaxID=1338 RepID=UPI00023297DE|nr:hypothetical protein [Streptococcus intermedius]EHG12126.1 hypothetical protein HMPREF9177_01124 [Streptococcus intermedius F0413]PMR66781.1 hypothetical protein C1I62_01265 [Streptococcus intermedius]QKH77125.1 hypothetical protein FOC71_00675 [Streptococcus intermedius]RSJ09586.1 hypothetical protein D8833_08220 [Streptococcus intermedius]RSJ15555.1 hypothetical protein D8831_08350 [Streptococcus intermedius]